jgi:hypothetical protein
LAGTIIVDRIESDASYTSTINVANRITFSNTVNFGVFAGTAPVAGFYLPTTNNLAFTTASTERMRITSAGNVGIGTNSPAVNLEVKASSGSGEIRIDSSASDILQLQSSATESRIAAVSAVPLTFRTSNVEAMRIDSSGNLGIGTSSFSARLNANLDNATAYATTAPNAANCTAAFTNGSAHTSGGTFVGYQLNISGNSQNRIGYIGAISGSASDQSLSLVFGTNTAAGDRSEKMRLDSNGNLLVNVTSTSSSGKMKLAYAGATQNGIIIESNYSPTSGAMYFNNPNGTVGTIVTSASSTAYNTSSDYRLKENIAPMTGALTKIANLKPVTYNWKKSGVASQGFIAHELQEVVPECVTGVKDAVDSDGKPVHQGVDTSFLVATLAAAIQEQQALITALTTRITALENN